MGGIEAAKLSFGVAAGTRAGWAVGKAVGCLAIVVVFFVIALLLGLFSKLTSSASPKQENVVLATSNDQNEAGNRIAASNSISARPESAGCLQYEVPVSLRGRVGEETFPGRPNYESVAKGDEPETVWVLSLDAPICTLQGDIDEPPAANVQRIQLVLLKAGTYDRYQPLLANPVTVTGNLGFGITAHYHTDVSLKVANIEP